MALDSAFDIILRWGSVVSGLGSFVLTAGLVYLYQIQTNISNEQKALTENQHKSILRVEDYFIASAQDLDQMFRGEYPDWFIRCGFLSVTLSNFGKSAADDLYAKLYFEVDGTRLEIKSVMTHGTDFDSLAFTGHGGVIGPNERGIDYATQFHAQKSTLPFEWSVGEDVPERLSPSEIMWTIADAGFDSVEIGIQIHFEDGTGKRNPLTIFTLDVDLQKYHDFRSACTFGTPVIESPNVDST